MAKKWYIVHTYTGQEEKVRKELENKLRIEGLEGKVEEILVPTEEVMEIKRGKRKVQSRTVYPGYLFIKMELDKRLWYLIRRIPGVTGFVSSTEGKEKQPLEISEEEIEKIKIAVEERKAKPKPKVVLEVGENVKIVEGPFTNFTGYIEEVDVDKGRVTVMVSIFGRSTPVELEYWQVEKI